ncbi:MAG: DnaJ domain-containing protein [Candidatus Limnocylindrales bacterium]|jgi:curved DNA-binding protein CbpA
MSDPADLYKLLQVDSEADLDVIQAAYRRLAQKFHPDVAGGTENAERMVAINAAWEVLQDPARRSAYDLQRATAQAGGSSSQASPPGDPGQTPAGAGPRPSSPLPPRRPAGAGMPPPEPVNSNWTSGRSNVGGGYDEQSMRRPDGEGAAGPPPGQPSGSLINFGRYSGWSLGEIGRRDLEYLEWLDRMTIGRPYRDEIDVILRRTGRRKSAAREDRPGLFRRR